MMASLSSSSPVKPLRLKDFLREDTNSDSFGGAGGFGTVPRRVPDHTVRYLLAVELGESAGGDRSPRRCRSKGTLTKITAVINAVKMLPSASSPTACSHEPLPKQGGFLSRSFSRKLRRSFWKKRDKGEHRVENNAVRTIVRMRDIVRLRSFGDDRRAVDVTDKTLVPCSSPSPVRSTKSSCTSSCTSSSGGGGWSDTDSSGSDSVSCGSSVCCGEVKMASPHMGANHCASSRSPSVVRGVGKDSLSKTTCYREPEVKEEGITGGGQGIGCPCRFEEEKDQLSPVSVMDFPYEDEDDENDEEGDGDGAEISAAAAAASPTSFHHSLANLERTKHSLLQKIREFESLAALVDPVNLDSRFASSLESDWREGTAGHDDAGAHDQPLQFQVEIEERSFALLHELKRRGCPSTGKKPTGGGITDGLLVDFFLERLSSSPRDDVGFRRRCDLTAAKEQKDAEEAALLRAAEEWIGGHRRGEEAVGWAAEVREMEKDGRWKCAHVEEEIAGDVGARVLESLVDELLVDLFQI